MEITLRVHVVFCVFRRISLDILAHFFAIFSPYESTLRADDGSVPYFPICKGRCHDNQIILP